MKLNIKTITKGAKILAQTVSKHSPTILTVVGVCCMIGAVAVTSVEAPKAKEDLNDLEEDDSFRDISHKEYIARKVRIILYHYWKTAALTVGGTGIIFWGHKISLGRTAAALAAYQMSKDDLKKLEEKIIETDGEKHLDKLKEEVTKDEIKRVPFNSATVINTGHGNTLFYDPIGRDYFLSDMEFIRQMRDEVNLSTSKLLGKNKKSAISYDIWRDYIGLPPLDGIVDGRQIGFAIGKNLGWINRNIELKITCAMLQDDTVCHILGYTANGAPKWCENIDDYYWDDIDETN